MVHVGTTQAALEAQTGKEQSRAGGLRLGNLAVLSDSRGANSCLVPYLVVGARFLLSRTLYSLHCR